ncbi:hypothetical protein F5Y17DRAFT_243759 [Xylariaceae sp. FL0594]|nr:hypothetical protein F5Y17DRAFT_243759 [Xylariaceae sp. FL0594]
MVALHCKMETEKLNRLMFFAMLNDVQQLFVSNPNTATLGPLLPLALQQLKKYAGHDKDLVESCGIAEVEELAWRAARSLREQDLSKAFAHPYFASHQQAQKMELLTRLIVRGKFKEVLAGRVNADLIDKLHTVFFDMVFPTPRIHLSFLDYVTI